MRFQSSFNVRQGNILAVTQFDKILLAICNELKVKEESKRNQPMIFRLPSGCN